MGKRKPKDEQVTDSPVFVFRRPGDGRKWRRKAEARHVLFWKLLWAFADYPSINRLAEMTGWSRRKVCYVLGELEGMGLVTHVGRKGQRGTAIRRLRVSLLHSENRQPKEPESARLEPVAPLDPERDWMKVVLTWPGSFPDLLSAHAPAGWRKKAHPRSIPKAAIRKAAAASRILHSGLRKVTWSRDESRKLRKRVISDSFVAWRNSGVGSAEGFLMFKTPESPSKPVKSSLSAILETGTLPQRFFLSARACAGILRRAEKRGRELPERLRRALEERVAAGD